MCFLFMLYLPARLASGIYELTQLALRRLAILTAMRDNIFDLSLLFDSGVAMLNSPVKYSVRITCLVM